jgi:hypothetical protein
VLPKDYEITRAVNNATIGTFMLRKPIQVWTLIDLDLFLTAGLEHNKSAFLEDQHHDWTWEDQYFHFYGHSGRRYDIHTLILVYEK